MTPGIYPMALELVRPYRMSNMFSAAGFSFFFYLLTKVNFQNYTRPNPKLVEEYQFQSVSMYVCVCVCMCVRVCVFQLCLSDNRSPLLM